MFSFDKDKWCRAGRHRERSERPRDARDRMHPFLCCRGCVSSPHLVPTTSTLDAWSPGAQVQGYRTVFLQFSWIPCSVCRLKPRCPQLRRSMVFGRGDFPNGVTGFLLTVGQWVVLGLLQSTSRSFLLGGQQESAMRLLLPFKRFA